jgi:hypothetical protein
MSRHALTAEQWRIVSYLYHPDQLARRVSPALSTVIRTQAVARDSVIEVVERGLVQARVGGEECARGPLQKLSETAIRLRLTRSGIYHAGNDPQHAVMCALRFTGVRYTLWDLMYRLNVPQPRGSKRLAPKVTYGELCEMADRHLFTTFLAATDTWVAIQDVKTIPGLVYATQTGIGKSYVAYV